MFAEVPTFNVDAVPNPVILVLAIELTANVIFPDEVIGEFVTVNSDEPASATPTEVTVPTLAGVITVNVIVSDPNVAVLFVVHKKILLSFAVPLAL